jgi:hypothetical protein
MAEANPNSMSGAFEGTDTDHYQMVEDSADALSALFVLLEETIDKDAGALEHISYGIGQIGRTHVQAIRKGAEALAIKLRNVSAEARHLPPGWVVREVVGSLERAKLSISTVQDVILSARGNPLSEVGAAPESSETMVVRPAYRHGMEQELSARVEAGAEPQDGQELTAAHLRDRFIADRLREGVGTDTIAMAMNLRRSAVEKVAAKLTTEAPDHTPASKAG